LELARWIESNHGKVDHVFAVAGTVAPFGNISQITPEQLDEMVRVKIANCLYAAQALIPLLKDEATSTYTVVTGLLGEVCFAPNLALTTVGNAAEFGLTLAIQAEAREKKYRVNEFRIGAKIVPDGVKEHPFGGTGAPHSVLSQLYYERIIVSNTRDAVVRVTDNDVGL